MRESLRVRNIKRRLREQRRLRWAVVIISAVGGGLSIVLNVVHAPDNPFARLTGAWPPIAVVVTVELVSRIPATNGWLASGRVLVTVGVGGGAFYVSFVQQYDYMLRIGWEGTSAWIFPLITDGVVVVALLSMIEVVRAIRTLVNDLDAIEVGEIEAAEAVLRAKETADTPPAITIPATVDESAPVEPPPAVEPVPVKAAQPHRPRGRKAPARATQSAGIKARKPEEETNHGMTGPVVDAVFVEPAPVMVD